MPIRQPVRFDRSGNIKAALSDEIKAKILQIAHERVLAGSKDATILPTADDVLNEATLLLKFFE